MVTAAPGRRMTRLRPRRSRLCPSPRDTTSHTSQWLRNDQRQDTQQLPWHGCRIRSVSIYRGQKNGAVGTVLADIDERFGAQPGKMKEALNSLITPPTYDPALKWGAFELLPVRRKGFSKGLIRIAVNRLNTQVFTLGWELPFTNSGKQLVRSPRRSSSTPPIFWKVYAQCSRKQTWSRIIRSLN